MINDILIPAGPYYKVLAPGPSAAVKIPTHKLAVKALGLGWKLRGVRKDRKAGKSYGTITGEFIGGRIVSRAVKPVKTRITQEHVKASRTQHDVWRKNGIGGRSWITKPGRYKMVIVFHDANKAGPHIDVHIDRMSLIYRVKPEEYSQLRYNRDGILTEDSRKLLLDFVRREVSENRFCAQNLDHTKSNARASWVNGDTEGTNYGDGYTRQIISESEVLIYKAHHRGPIEMYAPVINPHRPLYLFRAFWPSRKDKKAPTVVWGVKSHNPPKLEDRLHLKPHKADDEDKFLAGTDPTTMTVKYDGASCYFVITPKGTTVWSPRTSKKTGEAIEYTHKVGSVSHVTSTESIVGMGELLFKDLETGSYLSAAEVGGILNANAIPSSRFQSEVMVYRVDRVGRKGVLDLPFHENRQLQHKVAKLDSTFKVVELTDLTSAHQAGLEGVVAVPEGESVINGFKLKWGEDCDDWRVDSVEFTVGERGGMAGVVRFTSLESGKSFKMGPGQMGNRELHQAMMDNPEDYVDKVAKVCSNRGHEGRAATFVEWHLDK